MQQNIYDNPLFFKGYKKLRDEDKGFNEALEVPVIHHLLSNIKDSIALDLGCGFGHQVAYLIQHGAAEVIGVDISKQMINEARSRNNHNGVKFFCTPMESFDIGKNKFEIILSLMALHYIEDINSLFNSVFTGLKNGGQFIFSIEHPICTACQAGWKKIDGKDYWMVSDYSKEGLRLQNWFVEGVHKYHRKVSSIIQSLVSCGFMLTDIREPHPSKKCLEERNDLALHLERPPVLIIRVLKPPLCRD